VKRAALYGTASGIVWALFATFVKSVTDEAGADGVLAVLTRGAIYGLVVAGIVGTVLTQAALHYGPLSVSQPLMVIVNPLVSIVLGIWLFGEHFDGGSAKILFGAMGFGAMALGVVFLARTAPSLAAASTAA
jgi:hypothetical protein